MPHFHTSNPTDFADWLFSSHSSWPLVKIRINPSGKEYTISRGILVSQCPYFANMFGGGFVEGKEQTATIQEIDGVLSVKSFELPLAWLYTGEINCGIQGSALKASALIQFARLADMYDIGKVEAQIAELLKKITSEGSSGESSAGTKNDPDANTHCLTSEDIRSAVNLPMGHRVRSLVAEASVEGFRSKLNHKFAKEVCEVPGFAADLLLVVREALETLRQVEPGEYDVRDPISNRRFYLQRW